VPAQDRHLVEIAAVFLKLGITGFGGPAVHLAMMEEEVVVRRRWMSRELFLDYVGAANLIPGPTSTEMTMHCGFHRGGPVGLVLGGLCFLAPAALITSVLAALYARFGRLPNVEPFLYGIQPAVIAVIAGAIWRLGAKAVKGAELALLGVLVLAACLLGVGEIPALLAGGVLGALWLTLRARRPGARRLVVPPLLAAPPWLASIPAWFREVAESLPLLARVFLVFLKIGTILFGSGYVLVAYLDAELVQRLGLLDRVALLDAVAVGQITPGPLFTTATFVGYQLAGAPGAALATLGMFLPAFLFVAVLGPLVPRLRAWAPASRFLDAVNVSAVAVMLWVTLTLARQAIGDWRTAAIAAAAVVVHLLLPRVTTVLFVAGGAVAGYLLRLV
jgi:chromate transporter